MALSGGEIRETRRRLQLSQTELASRLGVKQPSISRIEKGQKPSGAVQVLLDQWLTEIAEKSA